MFNINFVTGGGPSPSSHGGEIVKLSFKSGGQRELSAKLRDALAQQHWKMQQVRVLFTKAGHSILGCRILRSKNEVYPPI